MSIQHTPGPWTAQASASVPMMKRRKMPHGEADSFFSSVFGLDRAFVCHLYFGYGKPQDSANARLIAAAPELLEIVRYVYDTLGSGAPLYNTAALHAQLCKVLARIEPEQP